MDLQNPELTFDEQNPRLDIRHTRQGQMSYSLNGQTRCHFDNQRMLTSKWRVPTGTRWRAHVRGELLLEILHQQVNAQFRSRERD